ncbi:MAG: MiaB/RimO family radical SAM methylthiotransferase [Candidatus Wallbacteria bacterium]|nr:MiaB/RimO family radical SAM methylthiotransferase [Candidatus Wallbacteria bacterium]
MKRFYLHTFGCKVNQYEGEILSQALARAGYQAVEYGQADLVVIKSCCVTSVSESKSARFARTAASRGSEVWIVGCCTEDLTKKLEGCKVNFFSQQEALEVIGKKSSLLETFSGHTRAFVKIQDGCDNFCTYCVIPFLRPQLSSRPHPEIIREVKGLVGAGFHEVVLTGIHLGRYQPDPGGSGPLASLIRSLSEISGLYRVRLGSLHPQEVTGDIIEELCGKRLSPHLHLSVQSGSDSILRSMNRNYTSGSMKDLFALLRKRLPDIELTCDLIAGFPGESDKDFSDTAALLRDGQFAYAHIFPFSSRKGTAAAEMAETAIKSSVIRERAAFLRTIRDDLFAARRKNWIGKTLSVLIEHNSSGFSEGFSENYLRVRVNGSHPVNSLIQAEITGFEHPLLTGEAL